MLPTAATVAGVVSFTFGLVALGLLMLFYQDRISPYLLLIPVIAAVQFVFTLACAFLVAAGNVFFRDLGNVETHLLRLWWFLSPGLYSLALLDAAEHLPGVPDPADARRGSTRSRSCSRPIGWSSTVRRTRHRPASPISRSLVALLVASLILLALTTIVFKRLEPNFAKVI